MNKHNNLTSLMQALEVATADVPEPMTAEIIRDYGRDPYLILVSCLLSLRARDTMTYPVSKQLFEYAQTPQQMVQLPIEQLEAILKPIGFYRRKAAIVREVSQELLDRFAGNVPATEKELLSLKHIGRKTANLILAEAFDQPAICVDTHVHRLVQPEHLDLVSTSNPDQTEQGLKKLFLPKDWRRINYLLVKWGQHICKPNTKQCCCWRVLAQHGFTR